eukprot:scaffold18115_cov47-Cyclotella_meneghiniana.AAC.1
MGYEYEKFCSAPNFSHFVHFNFDRSRLVEVCHHHCLRTDRSCYRCIIVSATSATAQWMHPLTAVASLTQCRCRCFSSTTSPRNRAEGGVVSQPPPTRGDWMGKWMQNTTINQPESKWGELTQQSTVN